MPKPKRQNKSKEQLVSEMKHLQTIQREKDLVRVMFPHIADMSTIYNAQTALNALSGFIKFEMDKRMGEINVSELDLLPYIEKEKASDIKSAIYSLIGQLGPEKAKDVSGLLERFGTGLAQFSAQEFMKQPMKKIKVDQLVAK